MTRTNPALWLGNDDYDTVKECAGAVHELSGKAPSKKNTGSLLNKIWETLVVKISVEHPSLSNTLELPTLGFDLQRDSVCGLQKLHQVC